MRLPLLNSRAGFWQKNGADGLLAAIGRAGALALILTAHGLIAKLREREIEGARHTSYLRLKSLSCFGRIFVFNVPPLPLAVRPPLKPVIST